MNLKKTLKIIILGIIFLLPLLSSTQSYGFEEIKVLFFLISTTVAAFLWILSKPKIKWNRLKIAQIAFLSVLLLTSLTGLNPPNSLLGAPPYFQGLIVYIYLFLFSLIISDVDIRFDIYAKVLTGSGFIVALVANYQWILINIFGQYTPTYAGRVVSTFGQPNFYSGFLLLILPIFFGLKFKSSLFKLLITLNLLFAIIVSYSRAAIFIALIYMLLVIATKLKFFKKITIFASVFIILGAIILSSLFSTGIFRDEWSKPSDIQDSAQLEKRFYFLPVIWQLALNKYWSGYGLENITSIYPTFKLPSAYLKTPLEGIKYLAVDRSHNYFLDLFFFSGVLGLLAYIILILIVFRNIRSEPILHVLIIYLIWIQFQNQSIVHLFFFWFILGLVSVEKNAP